MIALNGQTTGSQETTENYAAARPEIMLELATKAYLRRNPEVSVSDARARVTQSFGVNR